MIIIVSSSPREASALASIAAKHPRSVVTCSSVRHLKTRLNTSAPAVVVTRMRLVDGYSDDVLALLAQSGSLPGTRVVVLGGADCTPKQEARQLSLGADCVLRDPLRPDVLFEYLAKFLRQPVRLSQGIEPRHFALADATVIPEREQIQRGARATHISPKEVALARLLVETEGKILTYDVLYDELFHRAFGGDSVNLRVLLGKLVGSCQKLGFNLRTSIRVLPKSGYVYLGTPAPVAADAAPKKKPRLKSRL